MSDMGLGAGPDMDPDDQLAAEHVVGVLTADERAQVETRMATDAAFADRVAAWEERLTPLLAEVAPETPPRVVWMRISAQLGAVPRKTSADAGLWRSVTAWRTATAVFAAAAAAAVAVLVTRPPEVVQVPAPAAPAAGELTSVALLKDEAGPTSFVVTFDRDNGRLIITPVTAEADADRAFELWLLPDGAAPVSLGVLNGQEALILRTNQLVGPNDANATLAVSLEPLGGSPTGLPTGPVVASGQLKPV